MGAVRTAWIFIESVYTILIFFAVPRGSCRSKLISFKAYVLSSQEIKKGAVKTTTLFNILKKMNFIYSFGTETLLLIQQLNLITEPSFPSVKISVLLGALPI